MHFRFKSLSWTEVLLIGLILGLFCYEASLAAQHAIYLWDESIYANNALEMERSGNYLVYTLDGVPDHHNSKPPLMLWLQALSFKVWGYNELAVRFPSFLAFLATIGLCLYYAEKLTGSVRAGIVAGLVVVVTPGLVRTHVFLTGDLDAVLVFWCSFIFFHHLKVIGRTGIRDTDIYAYAPLFFLGYLTKSTAVLLMLPSLTLSFALSGHLRPLLRRKAVYSSALGFLAAVGFYYLVRERFDPGYWAVVWFSEFTRVAVNVQPWLIYPWNLYFIYLRDFYFRYPLILLAITGPAFLLVPALPHKKLFLHAMLMPFVYLLVITIPPVKLVWYDAPVYPMLAFGLGLACSGLAAFVLGYIRLRLLRESVWMAVVGGLTIVAFVPLRRELIAESVRYQDPELTTNALRELAPKYGLRKLRVLEGNNEVRFTHALDALRFYQKTMRIDSGREISVSGFVADIRPPETVIVCEQAKQDSLSARFQARLLDSCGPCKLMIVP